jgi:hypothetical protein
MPSVVIPPQIRPGGAFYDPGWRRTPSSRGITLDRVFPGDWRRRRSRVRAEYRAEGATPLGDRVFPGSRPLAPSFRGFFRDLSLWSLLVPYH